ncbi:hypothetical protein Acr_29g0008830 [Actinidia rufa]|uniref:Retrovirus-related Pol polyprotein from transposon TNT 1-94-like beta-barrel domain-containing protein n=1 Tax=Actinidia rufa TaxID=165716 RepID=A0A7J0HFJ1_9ERIC|nr:hypothetical protein Acr_29g0008830 [Actinidia rufa]
MSCGSSWRRCTRRRHLGNKALLMRRLVNLNLQRETTVAEHMSEFQNLVNQLTSVDLQFDDEMQALLLLSSLPESWETLVVSLSNSAPNGKLTTSMVIDALFNEEARRRERWVRHIREGHIKRDCQKYKAQDQSSDTAATTVMADEDESDVLLAALADGKSDWVLNSGSAYHLCRDREVFSTYVTCEGRIWMVNNIASRVVGKGLDRFHMADKRSVTLTEVRHVPNIRKKLIYIGMLDSKECSFDISGGTLRVFKGNKEMLCGKKTGGLYRLEGSVHTGRATVPHGFSSISEKNGQRKQPLHRGDALGYVQKFGQTRVVQPVQDVQREAQRKETKLILKSYTAKGAATPKRVSFALYLISGGDLSSCAHTREEMEPQQLAKSYGRAGSEAIMMDNLKTSDNPPVGWRGRLLSPAHLDESKPTWISPSPVAKSKPGWSLHGVSM